MISFGECNYTVHSQPSYCLTIQYHPMWHWITCQTGVWYQVMIAFQRYIVNPPTGWPFNIIQCVLNDISLCQLAVWYHVLNASTHSYTVNPPTVWPFNIIQCSVEWYASLQYDIKLWPHLHSTLSTLLLSEHSISSNVVLNDINPLTVWPFNVIQCSVEWYAA